MASTYSYCDNSGITVAANKVYFDLFNASGSSKIVKVAIFELYHRNTGNVNGVNVAIEAIRTTTVGTGGTVLTADEEDTDNAALPAQITARSLPTGGAATTGNAIADGNIHTDETSAQAQLAMYQNDGSGAETRQPITLREDEGVVLKQGPLGAVGKIGYHVEITVE